MVKPWSKRRRDSLLALARYFDGVAASIRQRVRDHTPKRVPKPKLAKAA